MDLQEKEYQNKVRLLFLLAAGLVLCPFVIVDGLFSGMGYYLAENYMTVPCLLFLGSALSGRLSSSAKRSLLLSAIAVIWFLTVQVRRTLTDMETSSFGIFAVGYLLAFPYAAVTGDGKEKIGLKWIGRIYIAFSTLLVVFGGMLLLDRVPEVLASCLTWDGARVVLFWHPNASGCLFMLGIGFSLYFFTQSEKKAEKWMLAILMVLQFCVLALTNSRTTILMTCALIGGTVFFTIWQGSWKQFLAGAAAALVVSAVLFCAYSLLFDLHKEAQVNKLMNQTQAQTLPMTSEEEAQSPNNQESQSLQIHEETGEVTLSGQSPQGDLLTDMKGFNGRTGIWRAALRAMQDNPSFKIWGTKYVSAELSSRNPFWVANAHNSWMETLMLLGIPGLLMAMVYSFIAVYHVWILVWRPREDIGKKIVAMMTICVMGAGFLEAYLFTGDMKTSFINFLFFLCTGYLIQWNRKTDSE